MNILVVDDERDMQTLFEQRFRKEIKHGSVKFAFANSGEEAISYMNRHDHEANVVLSDINMPGMSGFDLLKHIRQKYETAPPVVMMVTAYGDEESYTNAMRLGADDFLTKPIDFNLLKQKMNAEGAGSR